VFSDRVDHKAEHVRADGSHFEKDELAYWQENVTLGVNMAPDYLRHDKFYDPEQDIWIDAVKSETFYYFLRLSEKYLKNA